MFRRSAVLLPAMLIGLLLAGCAGRGSWPGEHLHAMHDPAPAPVAVAHASNVSIRPWRVSVTTPAHEATAHQEGIVVDAARPSPPAYKLDTGDRLRVFIYGQPNLSRLYIVDQSGNISVPLVGNLRARGLTTVQLEGAIRGRLAQGLVRDPQVTVDVQQNRPFFILGEVRTPGQYPYVTGMTVETAVAIAGGYGDRANERKARLTRRSGSFNDVIDVTPDTELEPGDTLYIYERFF